MYLSCSTRIEWLFGNRRDALEAVRFLTESAEYHTIANLVPNGDTLTTDDVTRIEVGRYRAGQYHLVSVHLDWTVIPNEYGEADEVFPVSFDGEDGRPLLDTYDKAEVGKYPVRNLTGHCVTNTTTATTIA